MWQLKIVSGYDIYKNIFRYLLKFIATLHAFL